MLQKEYLEWVKERGIRVRINISGKWFSGVIKEFTNDIIILEDEGNKMIFYKYAIDGIEEERNSKEVKK